MNPEFYTSAEELHSVTLDKSRCKGCINCIKRCPTQAIRVRDGKAHIISRRCIDCGQCIRVCQHKAKKAIYDSLDVLNNYKYTVALPAPSLYAQFNNLDNQKLILDALKKIGFDDVFEVAKAAEMVSEVTQEYMESRRDAVRRPVISTACPAVTRLIRVRYPNLIDHLLPIITPVELAGKMARAEVMKKTGLSAAEIGCIFLTPCPAKVSAIHDPIGMTARYVDAAVAVAEIYPLLLRHMDAGDIARAETEFPETAGSVGIGWGRIGGESVGLASDRYLAADGIENVITVLEDLESHKYDLDFVELNACPVGCVGGVLQVENPYIARVKLQKLRKTVSETGVIPAVDADTLLWDAGLEYDPVMELGGTRKESFERYNQLQQLIERLPGLDCGSCGAPTCETFAEDVVKGDADVSDCVVIFREQMENVYKIMESSLSETRSDEEDREFADRARLPDDGENI